MIEMFDSKRSRYGAAAAAFVLFAASAGTAYAATFPLTLDNEIQTSEATNDSCQTGAVEVFLDEGVYDAALEGYTIDGLLVTGIDAACYTPGTKSLYFTVSAADGTQLATGGWEPMDDTPPLGRHHMGFIEGPVLADDIAKVSVLIQ